MDLLRFLVLPKLWINKLKEPLFFNNGSQCVDKAQKIRDYSD